MFTQSVLASSSPWPLLFRGVKRPLVGLILTLGLLMSGFSSVLAYGAEVSASASLDSSTPSVTQSPAAPTGTVAQAAVAGEFPSDGVYLYGQSAKPDQIGKTYAVFEVRDGKLVGAFYMPYSSFDCFYGTVQPDRLALMVVDSYERTASPYAVALERNYPVATSGSPAIANFKLQGFHPLSTVSENDQRILNTCRTDFAQQGK